MKSLMTSALFALLTLNACAKKEPVPAPAPAPAVDQVKTHSPLVLAYDAVREGLASDSLEDTHKAAKALETVAGLPEGMKPALEALLKTADLDAARLSFGELSKAYLTHIAATPALQQEGLIAFRCPMAKGYKLWVELKEPMRNPYMGKVMLECGAKVELTP